MCGKKDKRKRRLFLAFISPFIGLYTFYVCLFFSSIIISEVKKIDIGVGDTWYVPLPNECRLLFIDGLDSAFIQKNERTIVSKVVQIEQTVNLIIGQTWDEKYFIYDTATSELKEYSTKDELITNNLTVSLKLQKVSDFYMNKRDEIAGKLLTPVLVLSLIISIGFILLLRRLILGKQKAE